MDFVLFDNNDKPKKCLILDAKYKLINLQQTIDEMTENIMEEKNDEIIHNNYYANKTKISQAALYQIFTYSEIVRKEKEIKGIENVEIALLYPKIKEIFDKEKTFSYFNNTKITFIPIDLTQDLSQEDNNGKNIILKQYIEDFFTNKENIC